MSYYYNYYIGYRGDDGKIYPLGPYNSKGEICPAIDVSHSWASDLHRSFRSIKDEEISDKLRNDFTFDEEMWRPKYLDYKDLPKDNYIKYGYYLIEDVEAYIKEGVSDLFVDRLDPVVYAEKSRNETIFGKPEPYKDDEGFVISPHSCADYMFFSYPDYNSEEYECFMIRSAKGMLEDYRINNYVVLMTEG